MASSQVTQGFQLPKAQLGASQEGPGTCVCEREREEREGGRERERERAENENKTILRDF